MKGLARKTFLSLLAAVAVLLALLVPAWGQAPGTEGDKSVSVSKVERKNRAPVSKEVLRVKLPKPVETKLDNGLTVLILEDHRFPLVSTQFNLEGAGGLYEPRELPGLASATAQMLREGTKTRTSRQIAEEVEKLGASVSASAGYGSAGANLYASGLSDNFDKWFALAIDELLNPSFPEEELGILKQRMKVGLKQQRSQSGFLANERFQKALFGEHPASVVSATERSIEAMTPESLEKWRRERYVPQTAILGIAGDVNSAETIAKLKKWLAAWPRTDFVEKVPENVPPATARKLYLVDRPEAVQTTIAMGNIAIARADPDYIPMTVMNHVLGGGATGRLFLNLREEKGYTYGVYSSFTAGKFRKPWRAGGDVRTEVTDGALTEFFKEIARMAEQKVPEAELEEAKRAEVASFALSLEHPSELLGYAITRKLYGLPADYWETYPAKLMAVTDDDAQRVAQKYLKVDALQVVAVGDASKIKTVLQKYGPVETYDTDGKRK